MSLGTCVRKPAATVDKGEAVAATKRRRDAQPCGTGCVPVLRPTKILNFPVHSLVQSRISRHRSGLPHGSRGEIDERAAFRPVPVSTCGSRIPILSDLYVLLTPLLFADARATPNGSRLLTAIVSGIRRWSGPRKCFCAPRLQNGPSRTPPSET